MLSMLTRWPMKVNMVNMSFVIVSMSPMLSTAVPAVSPASQSVAADFSLSTPMVLF